MTITEKILARAAGRDEVRPGEFVTCKLDLVMANDITAPIAIEEFEKMGAGQVFDPQRVVLVADHFTPNKDIKSAMQVKLLRDFARSQGLTHFYEAQTGGIEHIILPDKGLSGLTPIPALTERWARLPPVSAPPTRRRALPPENAGSGCRPA